MANSNFDVIGRATFFQQQIIIKQVCNCLHSLQSIIQHSRTRNGLATRLNLDSYGAQLLGYTRPKMTPLFTSTSFSVLISFFFATLTVAFSTNSTTNSSSSSSASLPKFPSCLKPNTSWAVKEDHNIIFI